jgi:hypothetical protein
MAMHQSPTFHYHDRRWFLDELVLPASGSPSPHRALLVLVFFFFLVVVLFLFLDSVFPAIFIGGVFFWPGASLHMLC